MPDYARWSASGSSEKRNVKVGAGRDFSRRRGTKLADSPPPPSDDKKVFLVIGGLFIVLPLVLLAVGALNGDVTVGTGAYAPS